jgi:ribonuclease HI
MAAAPFRAAFDGGSRGNPGPAAWGVVVLDGSGGWTEGHAGYLGRATNNVAEYNGLIEALRLALARGATEVDLRADSELIVKQLNGVYRVKHPDLKPLFAEARRMIGRLEAFRIRHVRREQNRDADRLVNEALDRWLDDPEAAEARIHVRPADLD